MVAGEHLDDFLGGMEEFHRSAADVGAVAVLLGAVQVAVLAEVNHGQPRFHSSKATQFSGKTM